MRGGLTCDVFELAEYSSRIDRIVKRDFGTM